MGRYVSQTWQGNPAALRPSDRRGGRFEAYVPHQLTGWHPLLPADAAAFIAEAERRLTDTAAQMKPSHGGDICFWAESLGSSRIEGVAPSTKRVVHALARRQHPAGEPRGPVAEVIANIDATTAAQQMLADRRGLSLATLLDAHRILMAASGTPHLGGVVRTEQNWVAGNDWHPLAGRVRPAPAADVPAAAGGPRRLPARRRPLTDAAGRDSPRAVRDDPPLRRRQRPRRAGTDVRGAQAALRRRRDDAPGQPGALTQPWELHRRAPRVPVIRGPARRPGPQPGTDQMVGGARHRSARSRAPPWPAISRR